MLLPQVPSTCHQDEGCWGHLLAGTSFRGWGPGPGLGAAEGGEEASPQLLVLPSEEEALSWVAKHPMQVGGRAGGRAGRWVGALQGKKKRMGGLGDGAGCGRVEQEADLERLEAPRGAEFVFRL